MADETEGERVLYRFVESQAPEIALGVGVGFCQTAFIAEAVKMNGFALLAQFEQHPCAQGGPAGCGYFLIYSDMLKTRSGQRSRKRWSSEIKGTSRDSAKAINCAS